jgi:hypothetical protein
MPSGVAVDTKRGNFHHGALLSRAISHSDIFSHFLFLNLISRDVQPAWYLIFFSALLAPCHC